MSTYLIQAIVGLGITMIAALNYGNIYENEFGFAGDKSFGLTIAALGFLSASIGGVIHLNVMKKKGRLVLSRREDGSLHSDKVESDNEIPMQESMDKMTVQIAPDLRCVCCGLSSYGGTWRTSSGNEVDPFRL